MKNFLFQQSRKLVQGLEACGFLNREITDIPVITPAPETTERDWCLALHGLEVLPEKLAKLNMVPDELADPAWDEKSGYLNFNFTPKTYELILERDFDEIEIALTHSLRSPELHKGLGPQRQILTRFRRYDEDLQIRAVEIKRNHLPPEPAERNLLNASLWLRYQLESREQPWSPSGLSQCLTPYSQALNQCWEEVRLDAGGDPELFQARADRWKYQIKTIKAILGEILP